MNDSKPKGSRENDPRPGAVHPPAISAAVGLSTPAPWTGTQDCLIVFVKAPRPGQVKTRLARTLGPAAAAVAYRRLVETLLAQLAPIPHLELRFAPDDARPQILPWLRNQWHASPQGQGDLGQRLGQAFADAFTAGAQRVVVIGSDCPAVVPADIYLAWSNLGDRDVVLGPATDGGYWLIGLRAPQPSLFHDIPWSTSDVQTCTLARARAANLRVARLRELGDVDTHADWQAWLRTQSGSHLNI